MLEMVGHCSFAYLFMITKRKTENQISIEIYLTGIGRELLMIFALRVLIEFWIPARYNSMFHTVLALTIQVYMNGNTRNWVLKLFSVSVLSNFSYGINTF